MRVVKSGMTGVTDVLGVIDLLVIVAANLLIAVAVVVVVLVQVLTRDLPEAGDTWFGVSTLALLGFLLVVGVTGHWPAVALPLVARAFREAVRAEPDGPAAAGGRARLVRCGGAPR